jgi:hypothetical protein
MNWKFKPEIVTQGFYEGYILVDFPGYAERNKIIRDLNFEMDQDKGIIPTSKAIELKDKLCKVAIDKIREVNLVKVGGECEVKTIEALDSNPELSSVIEEIGTFVINGVRLSKN